MRANRITVREWERIDVSPEKAVSLLSKCKKIFEHAPWDSSLQATQYVGVVAFGDGDVVEVLPKISGSDDEARALLETIIRTVYASPRILERSSSGKISDSLLEFFVRMFCSEAETVIRRGIARGYSRKEENLRRVKGRVLFGEDARRNIADRSRVYVSHEVYQCDRPENRVVLATARLLLGISADPDNRRSLSMVEASFGEASPSADPMSDLGMCSHDRSVQHYDDLLDMCGVLLEGSHSLCSGNHVSISIFFDMNILYEKYVAHWIRRNYPEASVSAQDRGMKLFGNFDLRPDIVVRADGRTYILDTKWKNIGEAGVSREDAYQMHAYMSEYKGCSEAFLLYPKTPGCSDKDFSDGSRVLHAVFIDISDGRSIAPIRIAPSDCSHNK